MVQSYLIEEVGELVTDADKAAQWQELVNRLELEGQKELVSSDARNVVPVPFLPMTNRIKNIVSTLCPNECKVSEYKFSPIPYDALALILLARDMDCFDEIKVHYNNNATDPFAVGVRTEEKQEKKLFLIVRWGDEKKEMAELEELAVAKKAEEAAKNAREKLRFVNNVLEDPKRFVREHLDDSYFSLYI